MLRTSLDLLHSPATINRQSSAANLSGRFWAQEDGHDADLPKSMPFFISPYLSGHRLRCLQAVHGQLQAAPP